MRSALLTCAVVIMLGCGSTTTAVIGGLSGATPTATTLRPTATPAPPTATPTPGHLLVTIVPNSQVCSQQSTGCAPYVCHNGNTCGVEWACTSPAWPSFTLSNIGQAALTWSGALSGNINQPSTVGWSLSSAGSSLAGGASTGVSVHEDPGSIQSTSVDIIFTGPGQTVIITLSCGIG